MIFVHCHLECDHVLLSPGRRFPALEGGREGVMALSFTQSPSNFNTSFWSMFNQATSQCSPSTFQIHSHPILHHRYLDWRGSWERWLGLTFSNGATRNPHFDPSCCRHLGNLLQVNDKYISNNINKTFMSFAPIEKRILQRLEALDPSSHWRHARSASLLDFAAAKPSSNLLVVHVRGQSSAHKRNLLQQRREGRHFKRTKLCLSCCGHHSTQVPSLPLISFSDSVIKVKSALKIRTFQNLMDLTNGKPFAAMLLWCPPPWHASLEITPAIISCCISDVIFRSISEVTTPPEDPRG